ncbi:MAG: flagellar hook-associated protein FlgK [Desulfobacterales bacterium]
MGGLGLVLSIAKDAIAAQRYGLDVTAHNIANVNTEGYSRQRLVLHANDPAQLAGIMFGRGVDAYEINRLSDQVIENQLMQQNSEMLSSEEKVRYAQVLENIFSESSRANIGSLLVDYWNLWQDISNNPSGMAERGALYEHSVLLATQFAGPDSDMTQLQTDLTLSVSKGVERINQISGEIAEVNNQIVRLGADAANDLRDRRNILLTELGQYIDVKTFDQSNGTTTVTTARGAILVYDASSYQLQMGSGVNGNRIEWVSSSGSNIDITDYITRGQIGGWLDMRDGIIAKYQKDLDAVAQEFIWTVNQQHSQGLGLKLFETAVTGTYTTGASELLSTLAYGDKIDYTKDFKMWTYDTGSTFPVAVDVDMGISTANPTFTNFAGANSTYEIEITQGGVVDTDGVEFRWRKDGGAWTAATMLSTATDVTIDGSTVGFSTGDVLVAGNHLSVNTVAAGAPDPLVLTPSGTANDILDTYTFTVTTGGTIPGTPVISWSNSTATGTLNIAATGNYTVDGMTLNIASGDLEVGDTFTITTDASGSPTAALPSAWHWTLDSFADQFNRQTSRVTASKTVANALTFAPVTGGSGKELKNFAYSGGVTAANTTVTIHNYDELDTVTGGTKFRLDYTAGTWTIAQGDPGYGAIVLSGDANGVKIDLSGVANGSADLSASFATALTADGYVEFDISAASGTYSFAFSDDSAQDSGLAAALGINTFFTGTSASDIGINSAISASKDNIAAAQVNSDGTFGVGDNTNALAIASLQYSARTMSLHSVDRTTGTAEGSVTTTIEDYYASLVGSVGMISANIQRSNDFNQSMVNSLTALRDNISAVSLDEEMANLIKYQHAYTAAAKLLGIVDEMLATILQVK